MDVDIEGIKLTNVHPESACAGRACVIHNPLDHKMRGWKLIWRNDRKIFERLCEHGCGHPDPSQGDYWRETGQEWQWVHGCCGCCIDGAGELAVADEHAEWCDAT